MYRLMKPQCPKCLLCVRIEKFRQISPGPVWRNSSGEYLRRLWLVPLWVLGVSFCAHNQIRNRFSTEETDNGPDRAQKCVRVSLNRSRSRNDSKHSNAKCEQCPAHTFFIILFRDKYAHSFLFAFVCLFIFNTRVDFHLIFVSDWMKWKIIRQQQKFIRVRVHAECSAKVFVLKEQRVAVSLCAKRATDFLKDECQS